MKTIKTYDCECCGETFYEDDKYCINCQVPVESEKFKVEIFKII